MLRRRVQRVRSLIRRPTKKRRVKLGASRRKVRTPRVR